MSNINFDIDGELHRRLRIRCAELGVTIKFYVTSSVEEALSGKEYKPFEVGKEKSTGSDAEEPEGVKRGG